MSEQNDEPHDDVRNVNLMCLRVSKILRRQNFSICFGVMMSEQEGFSFAQFVDLWSSMHNASRIGTLDSRPEEKIIQVFFVPNVVGEFYMDGQPPKFYTLDEEPVLQFKHTSGQSLVLFQRESAEAQRTYQSPRFTRVVERRVFYYGHVKFEFVKMSEGQNVEDACNQEPIYLVRVYQAVHEQARLSSSLEDCHGYCERLYRCAVPLLGQGPNPSLARKSFKYATRLRLSGRKEITELTDVAENIEPMIE